MKTWKLGAALVGALSLFAWLWVQHARTPVTSAPGLAAVAATPSRAVRGEQKVPAPLRNGVVQAYRPEVKERLPLPPSVVADPDKHVVSASVVRADDHPQEVVTVLDANTGEATSYVKEKPLPWLAVEGRGEFGAYYGFASGGQQVARFEVRQNVLQVKALRLQVTGGLDYNVGSGRANGFAGVGVVYRW